MKMNKVYLVAYESENGENIDKIKEALSLLGKVSIWVDTGKVLSAFVITTDEKIDAVAIRNKMQESINPFEEGVGAIEVNELDMADTNTLGCFAWKKSGLGRISVAKEDRNFDRFKTRHEAFVAYEVERPVWTYPDNIGNVIRMDIDEWLWMPIKKDGRYERGKYEKYLG